MMVTKVSLHCILNKNNPTAPTNQLRKWCKPILFLYIFFISFMWSIVTFLLDVTLYIYLLSLHILHFPYLYFSTCTCVYSHIKIISYFHILKIVYVHIFIHFFYIFYFNFSLIFVSDYVLLSMWLKVYVWLYVNVCIVCFCAFILFYLLWLVIHERQGMFSQ